MKSKETPLRPINLIPHSLLEPCPPPEFRVESWGDYPDYVARLHLVLEKCNADKNAIKRILQ